MRGHKELHCPIEAIFPAFALSSNQPIAPLRVVEISDFLPPHTPGTNKNITIHYRQNLQQKMQVNFGIDASETGRYIHSEQGLILAFFQNCAEYCEMLGAKIREVSGEQPVIIHSVILNILSYYTACNICTDTLVQLQKHEGFKEQLKRHMLSHDASWTTQDEFGLTTMEASLYPFSPTEEQDERDRQGDSVATLIEPGPPPNFIYHRVPYNPML